MNLVSYNVHGLGGKYLHHDFFKYLEDFHVFILLETHVEESQKSKYESRFKNYLLYWKAATRISNRGRAIGGHVCGIRKDLQSVGFRHKLIQIGGIDIIQCRLNQMTFEIVPVYLRGANWMQDFGSLKEAVEMSNLPKIVIGDHNARIGEEQQIWEESVEEFIACSKIRRSKDKTVNSCGRKYVEFCNNNGLIILNGRITGDAEGNFTFANQNGSSVIDLCAVSHDMVANVSNFNVENQVWSDHWPITLKLECNNDLKSDTEKLHQLPRLYWKNTNKATYQQKLNANVTTVLSDYACLADFISLISSSYPKSTISRKVEYKNKWFDTECFRAREKSMRLLNIYRSTDLIQDRKAYSVQRKEYHLICKRKQCEYNINLTRRLDTVSDSKTWWALAKEIRQHENPIGCEITAETLKNYFEILLNPTDNSKPIYFAPPLLEEVLLDSDFTLEEIREQLSKLKERKAPGEDGIPYEFFINATDEFLSALCQTYTKIFNGSQDFDTFRTSVIFPIHKKGDINAVGNYRGISFMNCIAKLLLGMINNRITEWTNRLQVLNEFQAGFRKGYSTIDNVFNLVSIINLKLAERKKVYSFFVDFKAAFDRVPRQQLIYKMHTIGLSSKIVDFIAKVYKNTKSTIWNGKELSGYFETKCGVKQGCLLSPLLFALYLNDLHDALGGGLYIDNLNVRLLMYADDIVLISDDKDILQKMINNLAEYCDLWGMEVNKDKSEVMVFRKGGRIADVETWKYKGESLRVVNEYQYLGITLTPKLSFAKHIENKNNASKICLNVTWKDFTGKPNISLTAKWKMFLSVCRAIQSYGSQIWGNAYFEDVEKLYRYFIKRILKLPENTPNYLLALETSYEEGYVYTYSMHLKYLQKVIFEMQGHRLPNKLSLKVIERNISWYNDLKLMLSKYQIQSADIGESKETWNNACYQLIEGIKMRSLRDHMTKARESAHRIYKYLNYEVGPIYCNNSFKLSQISCIIRARGDILPLNGSIYRNNISRICSICNMGEEESVCHFVGRCPIFSNYRLKFFNKTFLDENEVIFQLDGGEDMSWSTLYNYLREALKYRDLLINEFNY